MTTLSRARLLVKRQAAYDLAVLMLERRRVEELKAQIERLQKGKSCEH